MQARNSASYRQEYNQSREKFRQHFPLLAIWDKEIAPHLSLSGVFYNENKKELKRQESAIKKYIEKKHHIYHGFYYALERVKALLIEKINFAKSQYYNETKKNSHFLDEFVLSANDSLWKIQYEITKLFETIQEKDRGFFSTKLDYFEKHLKIANKHIGNELEYFFYKKNMVLAERLRLFYMPGKMLPFDFNISLFGENYFEFNLKNANEHVEFENFESELTVKIIKYFCIFFEKIYLFYECIEKGNLIELNDFCGALDSLQESIFFDNLRYVKKKLEENTKEKILSPIELIRHQFELTEDIKPKIIEIKKCSEKIEEKAFIRLFEKLGALHQETENEIRKIELEKNKLSMDKEKFELFDSYEENYSYLDNYLDKKEKNLKALLQNIKSFIKEIENKNKLRHLEDFHYIEKYKRMDAYLYQQKKRNDPFIKISNELNFLKNHYDSRRLHLDSTLRHDFNKDVIVALENNKKQKNNNNKKEVVSIINNIFDKYYNKHQYLPPDPKFVVAQDDSLEDILRYCEKYLNVLKNKVGKINFNSAEKMSKKFSEKEEDRMTEEKKVKDTFNKLISASNLNFFKLKLKKLHPIAKRIYAINAIREMINTHSQPSHSGGETKDTFRKIKDIKEDIKNILYGQTGQILFISQRASHSFFNCCLPVFFTPKDETESIQAIQNILDEAPSWRDQNHDVPACAG